MVTYRWSDPHVEHFNIIDFCDRPYDTVSEMNAALVANVNKLVGVNDTLKVQGDVAFGDRRKSLAWVDQIRCQNRILYPGNHDHCFPGAKKNWREWLPLYEQYFEVRIEEYPGSGYHETLDDGTPVIVSHFPYTGESHGETDRYSAYRPHDDGVTLLHGHVHDAWKIRRSPKGTLMINVGVDAWDMQPVSENTLAALIKENQDT